MADEKTEQPTPKKLKESREQGNIPRSKDLAVAAATLASVMVLGRVGGSLMGRLGERMASDLTHMGDRPLHVVNAGELTGLVLNGVGFVGLLVAPIAMATALTGVLVQGMQGGWNFAPQALQWDLTRLSPIKGIKRFGMMQAGADTLKTY